MTTTFYRIAAGHPAVVQAAQSTIMEGGNAFDAVVAAGFTSAIAEPMLTSLGGGGFLMARTAGGEEILFDFFSDTPGKGKERTRREPHFYPVTVHFPGSDQIFNIGLGSVAVPGNLKGFLHIHSRLGRLPLRQVLQPAIDGCRRGIALDYHQAYFLRLLRPIVTMTGAGRRLYCNNQHYPREGDRLYNAELAAFLQGLPEGGMESFYQGDIAHRIAADMAAGGGLLTQQDLAGYAVIERRPLAVSYRGHRLLTNPPPSSGGSLIGMALFLLEGIDFAPIPWASSRHFTVLTEIMREVDSMREHYGPDFAQRARHHGQSDGPNPARTFSRGTTHISIRDQEGNVAAMTTSNGEGSGYIVPGTGIMLNNMMGEDDLHPQGFHNSPPGMRISSMMSPSLVVGPDKQVALVLGSGGSKRIRTAIMQVLHHVIDYGKPIKTAVESPRCHWDGTTLQIEPGLPDAVYQGLAASVPINVWSASDMYFGGVHAIGPCNCAGDPRRGGSIAALGQHLNR